MRAEGPTVRAAGTWEHDVTAEPNTPLRRISPSSLGSKPEGTAGSTTALQSPPQDPASRYSGMELWLHRIIVLMFVFLCAVAGVLLVILPWRPEWTDNHLLFGYPGLRAFVANGFVRGLCSGLGVLDIWIGFWEAVHYHEEKRS
jgi:hypothetical protein